MTDGRYVYCIIENNSSADLGNIGLYDGLVYQIHFKDISALVSTIPFKEIHPSVNEINSHQHVVESSRAKWTTLPVRFGTVFKTDDGVKQFLTRSYKELQSKIAKFKDKEEYGLKVIIDKNDLQKLDLKISENKEIKKIKEELESAGEGTSYFLKMKMDEAIRTEMLKKVDEIGGDIHAQLSKVSATSCTLRSELAEIMLNSSYLIDRNEKEKFDSQVHKIKKKYEPIGITLHVSGPWAPYSFC
ncbi:MAG: GvpL/GvpF family gas vesicle protein [Candidatus Nitrosotenuis sp.]|nr:MAG: GvpL/GvpF family gas vesicle protein [Candidatus Nitrosotenuis sp.]